MSIQQLASVVTAHAWSPDGNSVAVCENEPDVVIYTNCKGSGAWKKQYVLQLHTMVVTGIDWSAATGKIVTCSHDVNAFVWTFDQAQNTWVAKVSILRIERAALRCQWSPDGSKFAVGSSSKVASICYFQDTNDWWVSKLTKRGQHKSTVLDVAWHPSSQVFATACCDFKCRVFSAFIPEVDKVGANTCFGSMDSTEFGQLMTEFESTGAWVEACAFSPSGNALVFCGHDSTISFVNFSSGQPVCSLVKTSGLPFTRVLFMNENVVVAAGHGFKPEIFQNQGQWNLLGSCDTGSNQKDSKKKNKFAKNFGMYNDKVTKGQTGGSGSDGLKFLHHNVITDMSLHDGGISTSASDGRIVVWSKSQVASVGATL